MKNTALRIVGFYALTAALWIFFSDRLLGHLFASSPHLALLQTGKGLAFIVVSAALLFLLLARELAGRHEAQEALQASEERFRLMTEHTTDIVTILEADGTIRYESASIQRILGYEPTELVGQNIAHLVHPDDLPIVLNEIAARLAEPGCISQTLQVRFRHKDGSWHWIETVGTNQLHNPAIQGLLINSRDITERRRAEEDRRLLASVVESSRDAIIVTTLTGNVAAWNRGAERVYGLKAEEVIGCPLTRFLPPEQAHEVDQVLEKISHGQTPEPFETVRTRPDGTRVHVSVTVSPTYDAAGAISGVSAIVSDITEKLRLQTLLIQQEKLAALGELVAGVAHEINNPLSAISGTAQLLQMHPDPLIQADANTIRQMCDRTAQIVGSLLTFARHPGSGARETTSLNSLIEPPLEMLRYKLRRADIELLITLAPDNILPPVQVDPNQIQQIIVNLLNNSEHALRGRQRGEKRLEITTAAEEKDGQAWALLTVTDNGCGIPEEARSRLFDPFFTTKPQGEGTGLGLSISYGIAQAHGGSLFFETEEGKGTAFTLRLPAAATAP